MWGWLRGQHDKTFIVTIRFAAYRSFMYCKVNHVGLLSPDADA